MKSKEEIDQLAKQFAIDESYGKISGDLFKGFIFGYTQCQKDMTDKKYTEKDMEKAFIAGGKLARNIENPGFNEFINSLN